MKLKSFDKVNVNIATEYIVFAGENPIDRFTVNYTEKDIPKLNAAIVKRMEYEKRGASVRFVDVNSATGQLSVTVEL